jgi:hypothetical protein
MADIKNDWDAMLGGLNQHSWEEKRPVYTASTGPGSNLLNAIATNMGRDTPFQTLSKGMLRHKRLGALKQAREEGLDPSQGSKYYSRMRELLEAAGDMDGAARASTKVTAEEDRALDRRSKEAQIKASEASTGQAEARTRLLGEEADRYDEVTTANINAQNSLIDFRAAQIAKIEGEDPEKAHQRAKDLLKFEHGLDIEKIMMEAKADLAVKMGETDPLKMADVDMASTVVSSLLFDAVNNNENPLLVQFEETYGVSATQLKKDMTDRDKGKKTQKAVEAEQKYQDIITGVAMSVHSLNRAAPQMSMRKKYDLALAAGAGRMVVLHPTTNEPLSIPTHMTLTEANAQDLVKRIVLPGEK